MGIVLKASPPLKSQYITADDVELTDNAVRVWESVEICGKLWDAYVDDQGWWYFLCVTPGESMFANGKKISEIIKSINRMAKLEKEEKVIRF